MINITSSQSSQSQSSQPHNKSQQVTASHNPRPQDHKIKDPQKKPCPNLRGKAGLSLGEGREEGRGRERERDQGLNSRVNEMNGFLTDEDERGV